MEMFLEREREREAGGRFIWWCHQNIWLHFTVLGHASLSCPVLLIWPVYRVGSVMRHRAYTSPHVDGPTAVPNIGPHIQWVSGGRVGCVTLFVPLTRTHKQTPVSPPPTPTCANHMHVGSYSGGGVVKYGTMIQVALTDLEDVVDGAGQRPAHGGYLWHVTCSGGVEWWHPLFNEQS